MTYRPGAHRRLTTAALLALVPLASACGADGSAETPATAATSPAPSPTEPAVAGGEGAYCDVLRDGVAALSAIEGTLGDPAAIEEGMTAIETVAAAAPEAVREDWATFVAFVHAATSGDASTVQAQAADAEAAFSRIEGHAQAECGIGMS